MAGNPYTGAILGGLGYHQKSKEWEDEAGNRKARERYMQALADQLQQALSQREQTFPLELGAKQRSAETEQMLLPGAQFGALAGQVPPGQAPGNPQMRALLQQLTGVAPPGQPGGEQMIPMRGATQAYNPLMSQMAAQQRPAGLAGEKARAEAQGALSPALQLQGAQDRGAMARTMAQVEGARDIAGMPQRPGGQRPLAPPDPGEIMKNFFGGVLPPIEAFNKKLLPMIANPSDVSPATFDLMEQEAQFLMFIVKSLAETLQQIPEGPMREAAAAMQARIEQQLMSSIQQLQAARGKVPTGTGGLGGFLDSLGPGSPVNP